MSLRIIKYSLAFKDNCLRSLIALFVVKQVDIARVSRIRWPRWRRLDQETLHRDIRDRGENSATFGTKMEKVPISRPRRRRPRNSSSRPLRSRWITANNFCDWDENCATFASKAEAARPRNSSSRALGPVWTWRTFRD